MSYIILYFWALWSQGTCSNHSCRTSGIPKIYGSTPAIRTSSISNFFSRERNIKQWELKSLFPTTMKFPKSMYSLLSMPALGVTATKPLVWHKIQWTCSDEGTSEYDASTLATEQKKLAASISSSSGLDGSSIALTSLQKNLPQSLDLSPKLF